MINQGTLGPTPQARRAFVALGLCLVFFLSVLLPTGNVMGMGSRALVTYIGSIEGDGDDGETVLAGYRWYTCNFTFIDWIEGIDSSLVTIERGEGEDEELFHFDPEGSNLTFLETSKTIDVKDPMIVLQNGRNLTLTFKIWIHLNWTFQTQVTLKPRIWSNGSEVGLDSPQLLRFDIYGYLQPVRDLIRVVDHLGNDIRTGEAVLSNSTISLTGLNFEYDDNSERFSGLRPDPERVHPQVEYGTMSTNATFMTNGFQAEIMVPDLESGNLMLSIDIPGVRSEWKLALSAWSFSLDIDGIGPKIEITKPAPGKTQSDKEFVWNITVTDRPVTAGVYVNGSTVRYRVWTIESNWSQWYDIPSSTDARSIFFSGSATGIPGTGTTMIQFMAEDVLGNVNITEPYPVKINKAPSLNISEVIIGLELPNNSSLELDGSDYVSDPDGDAIFYKWYLDDSEPLSTLANFRKPLFDVEPGVHTIKLEISDGHEEVSQSFTFNVTKAKDRDEGKTWFEELMEDENLFWYLLPIALIAILIPLIVLILFISRKARERRGDDFIIDEDRAMDMSQAEETAKRILDNMTARESVDFQTSSYAVTIDEGFDFDYDLYEVLGLESNATETEIKKKYRKLAAFYHPDMVAQHGEVSGEDSAEEMMRINKAKEVLLNPERRVIYDSYINDLDFSMDIGDMGDMGDMGDDDPDFDDEWT